MNKFKFLALSLVCATIAFCFNNAVEAQDEIDPVKIMNMQYQIFGEIVDLGIGVDTSDEMYPIKYAAYLIRCMQSGMRIDANNSISFTKPENYETLSYNEKQIWDQAESMLHRLIVILNDHGIKTTQEGILSEESQMYLVSVITGLFDRYGKYI